VGVIGYCSGGRQAYLAACTLRGLDAAVDCYGGGVVAKPEELTSRGSRPRWSTAARPART
jgi:carboxymethylenebutenolidase